MKKQNRNNKKLNIIKKVTRILFITLVFILILLINVLNSESIKDVFTNTLFWCEVGFVEGILLIILVKLYKSNNEIIFEGNDMDDTNWLTYKDLQKLKSFKTFNFKEAAKYKDGIVIGAEKKKKKINILETDDLHALIVGTTGAGKTTGFVDQNIEVLSRTQNKPSLIISDPKCELYQKHSYTLKKNGYEIKVLDLRDPYSSTKWNPLELLLKRVDKTKELLKTEMESINGKYETKNGEKYDAYKLVLNQKQILKDEVYENAKDLIYTLCPIKNKDQPNWEEGARNLILAFTLALLEDYEEGKVDRNSVNLLTIYHNIINQTSGKVDKLRKYLIDDRSPLSNIKSLANAVLLTRENTLRSYLSDVQSYLQDFSDEGIQSLTSINEMDLSSLDEKPIALFIIIPDEKITRHKLATLFITQLYKELCDKANKNQKNLETPSAQLKRNVYFILDEFGNLPQFENIESMVTVARSRGIKFLFVLQSYAQLYARYKKETAEIIKTNCNIKIFIGTDDGETRKEFSELCGHKKAKRLSQSSSLDGKNNSTESVQSDYLISPGELERLNGEEKGNAIVSIRGYEPIWAKFTPSFMVKEYFIDKESEEVEVVEENQDINAGIYEEDDKLLFNKEKYFYDIDKDSNPEKILEKKIDEALIKGTGFDPPPINPEIEALENRFNLLISQIKRGVDRLAQFLMEKDKKEIKSIPISDIAEHLIDLRPKYKGNLEVSEKIEKMLIYIEEKNRELKEIQESIKKII